MAPTIPFKRFLGKESQTHTMCRLWKNWL